MKKNKRQKAEVKNPIMREFTSGAKRDTDEGKIQFIRGLSPIVLMAYGEFMKGHNSQRDGEKRDEGNWKKGFPIKSFMESRFRHIMMTWLIYDGYIEDPDYSLIIASLCAEFFNVQGHLHEILLKQRKLKKKNKYPKKMSTIIKNLSQETINEILSAPFKDVEDAYEGMKKLAKKKIRPDKSSRKAFAITGKKKTKKEKDKEHFKKTLKRIEARKKAKDEKKVHYLPLSRDKKKQGTICGLKIRFKYQEKSIKTTPHHYHATCLKCKKIIGGWNK